jgi:hypothetical protein
MANVFNLKVHMGVARLGSTYKCFTPSLLSTRLGDHITNLKLNPDGYIASLLVAHNLQHELPGDTGPTG